MGRSVRQAIGGGQMFEFEAGLAIGMRWPLNAIRAQRVGHAHHVQQVPPAAFVLPLARVRVSQVAPQQKTRYLVIESNAVVTHADGAGLGKRSLNLRRKGVFGHPVFKAMLRGDAGEQAGLRVGEVVRRRLAIQHQRRADLVEFGIGANSRELGRTVAPRIDAKGFVVVPEKGMGLHKESDQARNAGAFEAALSRSRPQGLQLLRRVDVRERISPVFKAHRHGANCGEPGACLASTIGHKLFERHS